MDTKITGTEEAWDSRQLGADAAYAKLVPREEVQKIDEALGLQMISIRLDKGLIDSFKALGAFHGVGYQPLMRDALKRFADHELRSIVQGLVESQRKKDVGESGGRQAESRRSTRGSTQAKKAA